MGEVKLLTATREANEAEQLLSNALLRKSVLELESAYIEAMLNLDMKDDEGLRRYVDTIKAGRRFLAHLHLIVENGKLAQYELDQMKGPKRSIFAP